MVKPSVSLLISTYNWPEALELCLLSVLKQTISPDEILIADDGSRNETKTYIQKFFKQTGIPIKHIWHEDNGFRKTIILNEAIRVSSGEYIIQTDGDMILHPLFIQDHLESIKLAHFIRGSRSLIDEKRTKELLTEKIYQINWKDSGLINKFNSIHSPFLNRLFSIYNNPYSIEGVKGCNFSFWKEDFIRVNGFNNEIVGWGREDSELAIRMINNGVLKRHLKFKAVCFHLYHTIFSRANEERNTQMLHAAIEKKIKWAENGYNTKYPVQIFTNKPLQTALAS